MTCLLASHHGTALGLEPHNQADVLLLAAQLIPFHEEIVRVPNRRLAVVVLQLVRLKHILACRSRVARLAIVLVEGIDYEVAVDLDRLFFALLIEHEPAAKTAHRRLVLRVADRVDPEGDHFVRHLRLVVVGPERNGHRLAYIQLSATADESYHHDDRDAPAATKSISHRNSPLP